VNALRRNGYLIAASVALVLAALYLWNTPFNRLTYFNDYRGYVLYPVMILASSTILPLSVVLTLGFTGMVIRVARLQSDGGEGRQALMLFVLAPLLLIITTFGLASFVKELPSLVAFSLAVVVLFLTVLAASRHRGREGLVAVGMMLFASMFACLACGSWGLVSLEHADSAQLGTHQFQLALRTGRDYYCSDRFYLLYECDVMGWLCVARTTGLIDSACGIGLQQIEARLTVDPALNVLVIQTQTMSVRYPVAPIVAQFP